ncbi:MAG: fatty acid desaturase [Elusimicrobia bacterium]|nr:fatty acid desaturase [Elusimicrobiota bacterium]MDE2511035.1 fatty acid desaturase [Elusimicrobiota bacterium]
MKDIAQFNAVLAKYKEPDVLASLGQLANTALPYLAIIVLMHFLHSRGHGWLGLLLAFPGAAFMMRLFIIQHDCGHGSFFKSQRANDMVGAVLGVFTLTPYRYWRQTHAIHHATSGNLERRGYGDINTLTIEEYNKLSAWGQWKYRVYRSAPVMFVIGPAYHFVINHRIPVIVPPEWKQERLSILLTDAVLASILLVASYTVGLWPFLKAQLPVVLITASAGVWLFYIQHQFEGTYWRPDEKWDLAEASMKGCSYYELPRVLQWISGNIGFHHIHHLNSRIPNYNLEKCMNENPVFQKVTKLTLLNSLSCVSLALWDEKTGKLVGFDAVDNAEPVRCAPSCSPA